VKHGAWRRQGVDDQYEAEKDGLLGGNGNGEWQDRQRGVLDQKWSIFVVQE
jgi:hypothetical protein